MTEDEQVPITLSREDLYELAWSKPLCELAKDFGISDVALAKRCRRLGIPVPGRGYWARVDAGQQPYRPKLPKREPQRFDEDALTVAPSQTAPSVGESSVAAVGSDGQPIPEAQRDLAWLAEQLAFEDRPENAISVPTVTRQWDPAIQGYREELEKAAKEMRESRRAAERFEKSPAVQKRIGFDREGYKWRMAQDRGEGLQDTHRSAAFRVSLGAYERALLLTNTLALAGATRGFAVRKDDGRIVFGGQGTEVRMRITEMLEKKTRLRVRYDGGTEPESYQVPTGRPRITLEDGYREWPPFEDRGSRGLELQLNRVFSAMYRVVVHVWKKERERREFEKRLAEERLRSEEEARIRAQCAKAIAEERARRRRLAAEATRWAQSRRIRAYVVHLEATAQKRGFIDEALAGWADWALRVAEELDPTQERMTGATDSVGD